MNPSNFEREEESGRPGRTASKGALARCAAALADTCRAVLAAIGAQAGVKSPQAGAAAPSARATLPRESRELPRGNRQTVMVIKRDPALVVLAEEMLARLGYRPHGFVSGIAALEAMHTYPAYFDAALVDEGMSGPGAGHLVHEIRRLRPDIPILLISACREDECGERAHAARVNAVLRAPLLSEEIAGPIAELLAGPR